MLPVSAWPPGPPGDQLSPFGRPRNINLAWHPGGYVIPKGAWVVQTGANRVIMFRPEVQPYNPARVPGTGILPGQGPGYGPHPPPPPPGQPSKTLRVQAQVKRNGPPEVQLKARNRGPMTIDPNAQSIATTARWMGAAVTPPAPANANFPQRNFGQPGVSRETWTRPTHDEYLEAWRAWQRRIGRTDPPIRPLPGRVPPNFFGWRRDPSAPGVVLVNSCSGGTVLADGQNVVIAGCGFANITQAFSV
ncbi:MAG TPA: hypothetical protein VHT52_12340 [Stellaceae bacterium]|jgi:hypothetical protein|nr:hypothetical protein [Stellaceae bacterium]